MKWKRLHIAHHMALSLPLHFTVRSHQPIPSHLPFLPIMPSCHTILSSIKMMFSYTIPAGLIIDDEEPSSPPYRPPSPIPRSSNLAGWLRPRQGRPRRTAQRERSEDTRRQSGQGRSAQVDEDVTVGSLFYAIISRFAMLCYAFTQN